MATASQIVTSALAELNLPSSSSGSTFGADLVSAQAKSLLQRLGRDTRKKRRWPQLRRSCVITFVSGQSSYALPADFDKFEFDTHFDNSDNGRLNGPCTPVEWSALNGYGVVCVNNISYRLSGGGSKKFQVFPTPDATTAGQTISFEYLTKSWLMPVEWATGQTVSANTYRAYEGQAYITIAGGTTGATPPTHTFGSVTDGGVLWQLVAYEAVLAATDSPLLDEDMLTVGLKASILAARGHDPEPYQSDYEGYVRTSYGENIGATTLSIVPRSRQRFIGRGNIPETGFGGM